MESQVSQTEGKTISQEVLAVFLLMQLRMGLTPLLQGELLTSAQLVSHRERACFAVQLLSTWLILDNC